MAESNRPKAKRNALGAENDSLRKQLMWLQAQLTELQERHESFVRGVAMDHQARQNDPNPNRRTNKEDYLTWQDREAWEWKEKLRRR